MKTSHSEIARHMKGEIIAANYNVVIWSFGNRYRSNSYSYIDRYEDNFIHK